MEPVYWFRLPDEIEYLMSLKPAELRVYLVIAHSIQKDRHAGLLSDRQIAKRAGIGVRHVCRGKKRLLLDGKIIVEVQPGRTAKYRLPHGWKTTNCVPVGIQLAEPEHGANCAPEGIQHCAPVGIQTLESLDHHQRRKKKREVPAVDFSGTDDEKPENRLKRRLTARHGETVDAADVIGLIKAELAKGNIALTDFLDRDKTATTGTLTNPTGHYRSLARRMVREERARVQEAVTGLSLAIEQAKAVTPVNGRCTACTAGRLAEGYCGCPMGRDLARMEARAST